MSDQQPWQDPNQAPQGAPPPYQPYGAPPPGPVPGPVPGGYAYSPQAPWGIDPRTGIAYSDKQKVVAGVLQILLPFGIGRFYIGDTGTGVAQLLVSLVTCGIGGIWSMIDGILLLTGRPTDSQGRPLR